jgi:hypothetical protein
LSVLRGGIALSDNLFMQFLGSYTDAVGKLAQLFDWAIPRRD